MLETHRGLSDIIFGKPVGSQPHWAIEYFSGRWPQQHVLRQRPTLRRGGDL